jgi:hypothetical protein
MSKVDWSTAPNGAEFYASHLFRKMVGGQGYAWDARDCTWLKTWMTTEFASDLSDFEPRPTISVKSPEWPTEQRIDIVGTNGGDGMHYYEATKLTTAADFLSAGLEILSQRGGEYGNDGRECSFPQAAEAFNALTGHKLVGSDICLIIALVKQVRQYAQPSRFHEDSAVDAVNYLALQSELLRKERT